MVKKILLGLGGGVALVVLGAGGWVFAQVRAYDQSTSKVYDVAVPDLHHSTDPEVIARGKHLAGGLGSCITCHGENFAGGRDEQLGPLGKIIVPNITPGGRLAAYSDGELARLIRHGIKRDGTTVRLMPSMDWSWWPDADVVALVSYLRGVPPVAGDPGFTEVGAMAKVLDRIDSIPFDQARRIDHTAKVSAPEPRPDAEYGAFVATSCRGCHGPNLSGGPITGAPPDLPPPLNLTRHPTGLDGWTYEDFMTLVREGKRKDGRPLNPFMPVDALRRLNETETRALWAYLQSVPPRPYGER